MDSKNLISEVKNRAQKWLDGNYDEETKAEIRKMLREDEEGLIDAFYKDLEFGTGGLRGIMGPGTNRMNIYTVGMATQGYSNYLKREFSALDQISVCIAHDPRNNSSKFAEAAAGIFSGNGFKVYLFDSLRPTPELSFAIRHFGSQGGIVITASHNPKEYNGFKAYWDDGGQVISPHDTNIIDEVNKIKSIDEIRFNGPERNINLIGKEIDELYTDKIKGLTLSPEIIEKYKDLKIVYTPIHGTGVKLVPMALKKFGFRNIINVPEQDINDGNFPTVISPNPEEPAALKMALDKARETDADLVMATDPDADRVGIAVKDSSGNFILLNGNQTGSLLVYYLLSLWSEKGKLTGKEYVCKTIVTTELIADMAEKFHVELYDVLTGFKFIADLIKTHEGTKTFIGGGEESYGYLAGEFVRDKDAVMSCALIAEATAWAMNQGKSLYDLLMDIYLEFGFYKESLTNVVKKGKSGAEEIQKMMDTLRNNPPARLNNTDVIIRHDYLKRKTFDIKNGDEKKITLPKSNVLQFILEDRSKISVRPSGTEPKIKFYFSVNKPLPSLDKFGETEKELEARIEGIKKDLGI
jgi:phosphoglucomutase